MRITDIRVTKRGRVSIYLDGEFACVLHRDIFAVSGLKMDGDTDARQMEELCRKSQDKLAGEAALGLLSQRAYTAKGLRDKLTAKVDGEAADAAVARMEELGLVDDQDYAVRYAGYCLRQKGYSPRRALYALLQKGIDRETAEAVLAELEPETDIEAAIARIIRKKYMGCWREEKDFRRAVGALARLGHGYDDIRRVLSDLTEDEEYYDQEED